MQDYEAARQQHAQALERARQARLYQPRAKVSMAEEKTARKAAWVEQVRASKERKAAEKAARDAQVAANLHAQYLKHAARRNEYAVFFRLARAHYSGDEELALRETAAHFNKSPWAAYLMLCKAAADRSGQQKTYFDLKWMR